MGLLDDAIREHLELKRKHGADPAEVAREEREALGPARSPGAAPAAGAAPAVTTEEPGGAVSAGLGEADDERPEPEAALAHDAEPDIEWSEPAPVRRGEPEGASEPGARPAPAEVPPEDALEPAGEPTIEHRVEVDDAPPPSPAVGEAGDDVLDETPEFLQDAPEHDRLWFEQKPPRDFDF
jgi:hypothetical protein